MPTILAFAGSPRRGGNSEILLDGLIAGVKDKGGQVNKIILNELKISPCQECGGCDKSGCCVVDDDMQSIYKQLDSAGALVVASPIFFSGVSAQLKAVIDRCQCHWVRKFLLKQSPHENKRPGVFLSVRGQAGLDIFHCAVKPVKAFFGTEDVSYAHELLCDNIDAKGRISAHSDVLGQAYQLGWKLLSQISRG